MSEKQKVYVFDTTLRDGEQVPGCQLNTDEKVEIALDLEDLGVDIIEAGFPISSPGDFNSVVEISKNVKRPIICALSRALVDDINMAHVSLKSAERRRLHTGIGSSDIHIKHKFNSTREKILDQAVAAVKYARRYFDDIEFYPEDAGRADPDFLSKMVEKVIGAGATSGGSIDASNILKPALANGSLRCIGSTTYTEYRKYFEKDSALVRRFQKVDIDEPSQEEAILIMKGIISNFEKS